MGSGASSTCRASVCPIGGASSSSSPARTLAIVLFAVGIVLIVLAVVYFTVSADKLPAILGRVPLRHHVQHRAKRGTAALVLGLVSLGGVGSHIPERLDPTRRAHS